MHEALHMIINDEGTRFASRYTDPSEPWLDARGFVPRHLQRDLEGNLVHADEPARWCPGRLVEPEPVLAWSTLGRLAHRKDKRRVDALLLWRDLTQPAAMLSGTIGDRDTNVETADAIDEDELDAESALEVRPTEPALLEAIGWRVTGKRRWWHTKKLVRTYETSTIKPEVTRLPEWRGRTEIRGEIKFGDLRFRGNELTVWGWTKAGKPLKPVERPVGGKSAVTISRSESKIRSYLDLRGAVPRPGDAAGLERVPCSKAGAGRIATIDPRPGVEEARAALAEAIANTKIMPLVTRCPDYIVPGRQWTGGVTHCRNDAPNGQAGPWEARSKAVNELARMANESRLRAHLGDVASILDDAITDSTAAAIGRKRGYTATSAEKYGAAVIDRALDMLADVAEIPRKLVADNDNTVEVKKAAA